MENNLENKLKFLGAHIGCDIEWLREDDNKWIQSKLTVYDFGFYAIKKVRLLTKPLSKISDEDAIEVARLCNWSETTFGKEFIKYKALDFLMGGEEDLELDAMCFVVDFLRSKSYALPYMGLSVEEQVERGWVRLIE